jgi:hypothetical protein
MTNGQLWFDQTWDLIRQFDSTTSLNYALGPDTFQVPARAVCAIMKNHAVLLDMAETWTLEGGAPGVDTIPAVRCCTDGLTFCEAIGFADASVASGGYVAVNVRGFMPGWVVDQDGERYVPQDMVVGASGYSGAVYGKSVQNADLHGKAEVFLGMFVEKRSAVAASNASISAFFKWYGPRRMMTYT